MFAMFAAVSLLGFSALRSAPTVGVQAAAQDAGSPQFYNSNVVPVLRTNCARCHSGLNHRGGFSIDSRESLLKGGNSGAAIIPGHPEQSLLIKLVHQTDLTEDQRPMPPKSKLTDAEIQTLAAWIKAGARTQ